MSLWKRITVKAETEAHERSGPLADVGGDQWMAVVGESHYRDELRQVTGGGQGEHHLVANLLRDPANAYDQNCIQVVVGGRQVGNLARENAERFAEGLDAIGGRVACPAIIRRSDANHDWNVVLRVDYDVLEDLGAGD